MSAAPPSDNEHAPFISRGGPPGGAATGNGAGSPGNNNNNNNTTDAPPLMSRQRSTVETTGLRATTPFLQSMTPNLVVTILVLVYWGVVLVADCVAIYYWQHYKNEPCPKALAMMVGVFGVAQMVYIVFIFALFALVLGYLGYASRHRMESLSPGLVGGVIAIVVFIACGALFVFCWLIVGSVWVYPDTGVQKGQCNSSLYAFAFWFVTAQWIGCGLCLIYYCVTAFVYKQNPLNPTAAAANQHQNQQ